ncbi:MAG: FAD-binding protein [Sphaerochaetaceae bacterium]|nr:FAD-binding protein [Sphaerochaetaceae bacterium]
MTFQTITTDILVIGGGLAALKATHSASESGMEVLVVSKGTICSGSSFYPLMEALGCQAPTEDPEDNIRLLEEIRESSFQMHDEELTKIYIDEIRDRVAELPAMGIPYRKMQGGRIPCFAKRARDIFIWEDWNAIRNKSYALLKAKDNVRLMEHCTVIDTILHDDHIAGALCIDRQGSLFVISCRSMILATGGFGDLFEHNLNPSDVCGHGHILALDAGAKLVNMEFIQFIPGFMTPRYKVLFSEQILGYCTQVNDAEGRDLLARYLPSSITSRQCLDERSKHGPYTSSDISRYFDIAMMKEINDTGCEKGFNLSYDPKLLEDKREFISIYVDWIRKEQHIDLLGTKHTIAPLAQASNGGIVIDVRCATGVNGLYAAGEVAGSLHGADRHGGNASGSCLVFGHRSGAYASQWVKSCDRQAINTSIARKALTERFEHHRPNRIDADELIKEIRHLMWYHANVVRNERDLVYAKDRIRQLYEDFNPATHMSNPKTIGMAVKADHAARLSMILLECMLLRKESRGPHYREDYPEKNDRSYARRLMVQSTADKDIEYRFT